MSELQTDLIIPCYNSAHYVGDAIDSALAQTRPYNRVIVVDDGSQDDLGPVLERYGDDITVIVQENAGVSVARNVGAARSDAPLLSFLDADDRLAPDRLEIQLKAFENDPDLMFCDGFTKYFWSPELSQEVIENDYRWHHSFWRIEPRPIHISSWMMRRALWDAIGEFKPGVSYSEDADWLLRCRQSGAKQGQVPDIVSHRRLHLANATRGNRNSQVDGIFDAIARNRTTPISSS